MTLSSVRAYQVRFNRMVAVIVMIGGFAGATHSAAGALLVYEPFAYSAGAILDQTTATGINLAGAYAALEPALPGQFQLSVQSPGLTYGNLGGVPPAGGNRLSQASGTTAGGVTVSIDQDVIVGPGQAVFFSALFTFDDSRNGNHRAHVTLTDDDSGDELMFGEATVGIRSVRVSANTAATGGLLADGADSAFTNGQTLLLIGRYINSAAASGDLLELIGYDTADADVLPSGFDPTDPQAEFAYALADLDINLEKITSITFGIRGTENNFIDELRIGSTYASIVPEPATLILMLASARLIARRTRMQAGRGA